MTARAEHSHDTDVVEVLAQRAMVGVGALGTRLQAPDIALGDVDDLGAGADAKYVRLQSG